MGCRDPIKSQAGEVKSDPSRGVVKVMGQGAWVEQQGGLIQFQRLGNVACARVRDFQLAPPQHMQVAVSFAGIEMSQAAQGAGVMQLRLYPKPGQQTGQPIDGCGARAGGGEDMLVRNELYCVRKVSISSARLRKLASHQPTRWCAFHPYRIH